MFADLSLKKKLVFAFLAVASLIVLVGGVTQFYLNKVTKSFHVVSHVVLPTVMKVSGLKEAIDDMDAALARLGNERLHDHHPQYAKDVVAAEHRFLEIEKAYLQLEFFPGEEKLYNEVHAEWVKLEEITKVLLVKGIESGSAADKEYSRLYEMEFYPAFQKLVTKLDDLDSFEEKVSEELSKEAMSSAHHLSIINVILTALGFGLSIFLGMFSASSITKSLQAIIDSITTSSNEVASASEQISSSSVELSESSVEQAAAIQETASALEEVTAMIVRNSENARTSQSTSQTSRDSAEQGKRAAAEMMQSIGEINQSNDNIITKVEQSNQRISEIVLVINEISNKTKVINDIVFQTKLLSFNASVEAARAGEHGKGFAVVAEEVGHLAQMSGNAAKEISSMLEDSVKKVEGIVNETKSQVEHLMVEGRRKVENGNEAATKCGDTLGEILEKVQEVDRLVAEIVTASDEQSQGIQEINKAMSQLDTATNQNSAVSQQTASASEQLSVQSRSLNGLILDLNALITGKRSDHSPIKVDAMPAKASKTSLVSAKSAKVLSISKKKESRTSKPLTEKAVANGQAYPSSSDPRFEEV